MAKPIQKRICDGCQKYYEGVGVKFCSVSCRYAKPSFPLLSDKDDFDLFRPLNIYVSPPKLKAAKAGHLTHSVHYGDIHFPHHDVRALNIRNQILDFLNPEVVVDHGDTGDCESISKFPKDPFARISLHEEFEMMARDFGEVHSITPKASHIWLEGNHEERLKRLLWRAADTRDLAEILTLPLVTEALEWKKLLGLEGLDWELIPYPKHKLLFDKLILVHGSTVRMHSGYSAKAEHDRYGKSGLSGHTHRMGAFYHTDYNGIHSWHELGMLGKIRSDYVAHANWQQGMGVVTWNKDRTRWGFEPISIHDGLAIFRGLRFEG